MWLIVDANSTYETFKSFIYKKCYSDFHKNYYLI